MLDTLKNAALAALIVFALVYALGVTTRTVTTTASAPYHRTYPSTASERFAGAAEARTQKCSYDGDYTNDPPGCK